MLCLASIERRSPLVEIVVVDNASTDGSVRAVKERHPDVEVIENHRNVGFGAAANLAVSRSRGAVILLLDSDTVLEHGCMEALYREVLQGDGVAGAAIYQGGRTLPEYGCTKDLMGLPSALDRMPQGGARPLYVPSCCLATSRRCFEVVGGYDERYFLFDDDVEYCWQALRRGYNVRVVPEARARHRGGASTPGGYTRNGVVETSSRRIRWRERNALNTAVACAPLYVLPAAVVASLARTSAFVILLLLHHRYRAALALFCGVVHNLAWLPATIRRRMRPGVTARGSREAWSRVARRLYAIDYLRKHVRVRFVD